MKLYAANKIHIIAGGRGMIGSTIAETGGGGDSGYAAANGICMGLTTGWAEDLSDTDIRVHGIIPAEHSSIPGTNENQSCHPEISMSSIAFALQGDAAVLRTDPDLADRLPKHPLSFFRAGGFRTGQPGLTLPYLEITAFRLRQIIEENSILPCRNVLRIKSHIAPILYQHIERQTFVIGAVPDQTAHDTGGR